MGYKRNDETKTVYRIVTPGVIQTVLQVRQNLIFMHGFLNF